MLVNGYWHRYGQHYRAIAKLSGPIMVAQLGTIVTGFADTMMVGHYNTPSLAAGSLVTTVFNLVILLSLGFSYGITPLVGALASQGDNRKVGAMMRHVAAANVLFGLVLMLASGAFYFALGHLGQPVEIMPLVRPYYIIIWLSMIPVILTHIFRQSCDAVGDTQLGMWIFTAGNVLNIVGNYMLIFGKWGAPELGLAGAGWSTLAARCFMAVAYVAAMLLASRYKAYHEGIAQSRTSWHDIARVTRTSLPVALQMGLETGIFTFAMILVGWMGTKSMAAYQILLQVGTLGFMIYYAFGAGMAIKIAHYTGLGDKAAVRDAAHAGYRLTLAFTLLACVIFITTGRWIVAFFTTDRAVIAIAVSMLVPLSLYQLGDATQVTYANALRGTGQVMSMLRVAVVAYLLIGLPVIPALAFLAGLGLAGVYYGFFVALLTAGILFCREFYRHLL